MRFGLFIPQGWRMDLVGIETEQHWSVMRDLASYADSSRWDSLWVYDHFHTVPLPTDEATHEAWSLMAAYAATTSRIKLGQMCTAMSYRNPVYLAKVAATADIISGCRTSKDNHQQTQNRTSAGRFVRFCVCSPDLDRRA